jgi:hypothetical protein
MMHLWIAASLAGESCARTLDARLAAPVPMSAVTMTVLAMRMCISLGDADAAHDTRRAGPNGLSGEMTAHYWTLVQ